ncbi:MAG: fumarylacetoacetase [Gemmatimonadaceae bacterium]|nr:fumarylacetoacetase [Gemmatimonadaceae bacterium]
MNETHDPALRSWVESANVAGADFPIQNLPVGVFRRRGTSEAGRVGVAIGDAILDVAACLDAGLFTGEAREVAAACRVPALNALMALDASAMRALRDAVSRLLRVGGDARAERARASLLVPMAEAELQLPAQVGDYTDFYASVHHATNVGRMFRPDNPLLPNYKWVPIGYHGRASSLVVSGTPVVRPRGQIKPPSADVPRVDRTQSLDYELEVGAFVRRGNPLGTPVPLARAEEHLFGICLVNDWSARDIQAWEYQPLGPFLGKSFATTVSPWVVTMEALEPFRGPGPVRPAGDPPLLDYLRDDGDRARGGIALTLEVHLRTARMREQGAPPACVSRVSFTTMYWTFAQMLAHHTSNGCNLRPGDLIASGTVSGEAPDSRGCLLERTWRGQEPLELPGGEVRRFLEDGDEVILRGYCEREGAVRIGLGACSGIVLAAP